jgi:hypothetical protein
MLFQLRQPGGIDERFSAFANLDWLAFVFPHHRASTQGMEFQTHAR